MLGELRGLNLDGKAVVLVWSCRCAALFLFFMFLMSPRYEKQQSVMFPGFRGLVETSGSLGCKVSATSVVFFQPHQGILGGTELRLVARLSGRAPQAIFGGSFEGLFWVVLSGESFLVLWHKMTTAALPWSFISAGRL